MPHSECKIPGRVTTQRASSPRQLHELDIRGISFVRWGCDRCVEQKRDGFGERGEHDGQTQSVHSHVTTNNTTTDDVQLNIYRVGERSMTRMLR